jgi:hypothetical protein
MKRISIQLIQLNEAKGFLLVPVSIFAKLLVSSRSTLMQSSSPAVYSLLNSLAQEIGFVAINGEGLRNARLIEGMADFVRFLAIGQLQNFYTTISVKVLPAAEQLRLGGGKLLI